MSAFCRVFVRLLLSMQRSDGEFEALSIGTLLG